MQREFAVGVRPCAILKIGMDICIGDGLSLTIFHDTVDPNIRFENQGPQTFRASPRYWRSKPCDAPFGLLDPQIDVSDRQTGRPVTPFGLSHQIIRSDVLETTSCQI